MKKYAFLTAIAVVTAMPAIAKEPKPTGLALQQIQARDLETNAEIAFPAVMTVLQDSGYRIKTADKATGLIVAEGSSKKITTYNIWWGLGSKKRVPEVSAFIEQRGPQLTRVRLSFVTSMRKSRNAFSDEEQVTDPSIYKGAFEQIEKEIFFRNSMNATAPAAPAVPVAAPASPAAATAPTPPTGN